jgi:hypothetical protein
MIDIIIVLIIVACIIGTVFRGAILDRLNFSSSADSVKVSFSAENLTYEDVSALQTGDMLYLSGKSFGTLSSMSYVKQTIVVPSKDGLSFTEAIDPEHYTLTGEIEISGKNTDKGFFFDSDIHIGVGKVLNLESSNSAISIVITKITENEG